MFSTLSKKQFFVPIETETDRTAVRKFRSVYWKKNCFLCEARVEVQEIGGGHHKGAPCLLRRKSIVFF